MCVEGDVVYVFVYEFFFLDWCWEGGVVDVEFG